MEQHHRVFGAAVVFFGMVLIVIMGLASALVHRSGKAAAAPCPGVTTCPSASLPTPAYKALLEKYDFTIGTIASLANTHAYLVGSNGLHFILSNPTLVLLGGSGVPTKNYPKMTEEQIAEFPLVGVIH